MCEAAAALQNKATQRADDWHSDPVKVRLDGTSSRWSETLELLREQTVVFLLPRLFLCQAVETF